MPGFDGTGPMGMGPMTGGARGLCSPYSRPFARRDWTLCSWFGRSGRGKGFRNMFWATGVPDRRGYNAGIYHGTPFYGQYSKEQETDFLKDQSAILRQELSIIDRRIQELESKDKAAD
jgi:hypothetical protein